MSKKLFELIQTMTPVEKARFKKDTALYSAKKTTNYIKLFDYLNGLKTYSEQGLSKKFNKSELPTLKSYLYKNLIKSLAVHIKKDISKSRIEKLQSEYEVLRNKGMHAEAFKCINKAIVVAHQTEDFLKVLALQKIKRNSIQILNLSNVIEKSIELVEAENSTREKLEDLTLYQQKDFILSFQVRTKKEFSKKEIQQLKSDYKLIFDSDVSDRKSVTAKIHQCSMLVHFYRVSNKLNEALQYLDKLIGLYEDHPVIMQHQFNTFIKFLSDYATYSYWTNNTEQIKSSIYRLKNIKVLSPSNGIQLKHLIFRAEFNYYSLKNDAESLYECSRQFLEVLPKVEKVKGKGAAFMALYNHSRAAWHLQYYDEALETLNLAINLKGKIGSFLTDIQRITDVFFLILHYEIGNIDSLEYYIRSFVRNQKDGLMKYEKVILDFFKNYMYETSRKEVLKGFKELHQTLKDLETDPEENKLCQFGSFPVWTQSKIDNTSMAAIFAKKESSG